MSDNGSSEPSTHESGYCPYCNYFDEDDQYLCQLTDSNACEPCRELMELEEKIRETRKMLVGLADKRRQLRERVNHTHDSIVTRLPVKVATVIFELCLPEDMMDIDLSIASKSTLCAPFIISAVCRQWRILAHSIPQIWKTLLLCGDVGSKNTGPCQFPDIAIVEGWIERAGNYPLSISIFFQFKFKLEHHSSTSQSPESPDTTLLLGLIRFLGQLSSRWLKFKYTGPPIPDVLSSLPGGEEAVPQLRWLHVDVSRNWRSCESCRADPNLSRSLKLRPKHLKALSITRIKLKELDFDLQHLTELELGTDSATFSQCFDALQKAPNLTRCSLGRPLPAWTHQAPQTIFQRNLQYLAITYNMHQELLPYLLCPSLKTLVVSPQPGVNSLPPIIEFLKSSGCSLQNFSITSKGASKGAILSTSEIDLLCQAIPTLQGLQAQLVLGTTQDLITRLAEFSVVDGITQPRYLPRLQSLILSEMLEEDMSHWSILPDMFGIPAPIDQVKLHRAPLQSVRISVRAPVSLRDYTEPSMNILCKAIGSRALQRILWLKNEGIAWDLCYGDDEDILDGALDYFHIQ